MSILSFVAEYFTTKILDCSLSTIFSETDNHSIDFQFVQCLNIALKNTCDSFGWEFDSTAIEQTFCFDESLFENKNLLLEALPQILSDAVGHTFNDKVIATWTSSFFKALVQPENSELFKFIYLKYGLFPKMDDDKRLFQFLSEPFNCFLSRVAKKRGEDRLHDLIDNSVNRSYIDNNEFRLFSRFSLFPVLKRFVSNIDESSLSSDILNLFITLSDVYFASSCVSRESENAALFLMSYLIIFFESLWYEKKIDIEFRSIPDFINEVYITFCESRIRLKCESISEEVLKTSSRTINEFALGLEKELPFESEDGKKLADVYITPDYHFVDDDRIWSNTFGLLDSFVNRKVKSFFEKSKIRSLLNSGYYHILFIQASGGMGKSSLLSQFAFNISKKNESKRIFFVKFSRLYDINGNVIDDIAHFLKLNREDLKCSIIVLDAFDEFVFNSAINKNSIIHELCKDLFELDSVAIITTRQGYIDVRNVGNSIAISLCTFNSEKREQWIKKYDASIDSEIIKGIVDHSGTSDNPENELIGVPIILYMVVANKINLAQFKSKYELYHGLFGETGLWVFRRYDQTHQLLQQIKAEMYSLIQSIAKEIFNQRNSLTISHDSIEKLIDKTIVSNEHCLPMMKQCYPLVTYFRDSSKINEIEFAHKSIYEYYLAAKLFADITSVILIDIINCESLINFALSYRGDALSTEVLVFFEEMVRHSNYKRDNLYSNTVHAVELLSENYLEIIKSSTITNVQEATNAFFNAFTSLSKILNIAKNSEYITVSEEVVSPAIRFFFNLSNYAGNICLSHFNLKGWNLSRLECKNVDLSFANLERADLSSSDYTSANLKGANIKYANLFGSTMSSSNMRGADIRGAFLGSTLFNKNDMSFFEGLIIDSEQLVHFRPQIFSYYSMIKVFEKDILLDDSSKEEYIKILRGF